MLSLVVACVVFLAAGSSFAAQEYYTTSRVDHFSTDLSTYQQRYYQNDTFFGGPGSPIFVIMGGEGAIDPSVGLFYPFVYAVLAPEFRALVIEPEHRYYGTSLPFGAASYDTDKLHLLNPQQALADTADFIVSTQKKYKCTARGTPGYCPVITVGGSYPGFLSAMMRLRYPGVVDIGYAASAPMRFYSQMVDTNSYYKVVTESAKRAVPGCDDAVRGTIALFLGTPVADAVAKLNLCSGQLPPYMRSDEAVFYAEFNMLFMVQFANLNMANYPPTPDTGMARTCQRFVDQVWLCVRVSGWG